MAGKKGINPFAKGGGKGGKMCKGCKGKMAATDKGDMCAKCAAKSKGK